MRPNFKQGTEQGAQGEGRRAQGGCWLLVKLYICGYTMIRSGCEYTFRTRNKAVQQADNAA